MPAEELLAPEYHRVRGQHGDDPRLARRLPIPPGESDTAVLALLSVFLVGPKRTEPSGWDRPGSCAPEHPPTRSRARAISSGSSTALKPPSGEMGPKRRWGGRSADGTQKAGIRGIGDGTRQAGAHRVTRLRVGERDPARCATLPGDCRHRFPFPSSSGTFVIGRVP